MATVIEKEEAEALILFRERVADILPTLNDYKSKDVWLLRWLRARELNLDKAEEMFRQSLKWRKDENIDEISDWRAPDFIEHEFPFQVTGFDRDGCVVATVHIGSWNIKKAMGLGLRTEFVRYAAQILEQSMKFLEYVSTEERFVYQFVVIADLEGFSIKQVLSKEILDLVTDIIKIFEGYYPEALKCAWAVNTPRLFEVVYNLIKPLLTARTLNKIRIYGSNVDQWRPQLLKNIDPDQLPSRLGGSRTTCSNYKLKYGYEVFPWYDTFRDTEFKTVLIAAGKKHGAEYQLASGQSISWNFRSEEYDIGFTFQFIEDGNQDAQILFACEKVDSHLHLQRGAYLAQKSGTYTLILDNSGSRFRAKNVSYGIRIKQFKWPQVHLHQELQF